MSTPVGSSPQGHGSKYTPLAREERGGSPPAHKVTDDRAACRSEADRVTIRTPPVIGILVENEPTTKQSSAYWREREPVYIGGGSLKNYADAVTDAGAVVQWLWDDGRDPRALLEGVDGVLLPGGRDVNPPLYGEDPDRKAFLNCAPIKFDLWQCSMLETALHMKLPIRGICRGMQLLNVVGEGTLMQDLLAPWRHFPVRINHINGTHDIDVAQDSRLAKVWPGHEKLKIASSHHQAVEHLADGYRVVAKADDGVIEAMEKIDDPTVIGVQFHPERFKESFRRPFFEALTDDARAYRARNPWRASVPPPKLKAAGGSVPFVEAKSAPRANSPLRALTPRERHLEAGIDRMRERGYCLVDSAPDFADTAPAYGRIMKRADDLEHSKHWWVFTAPSARGRGYAVPTLQKLTHLRVEHLLLSLTPEGRDTLPTSDRNLLLQVMDEKRKAKTTSVGDLYLRKTGWLKKTPLVFDIEVVWALNDKKLIRQEPGPAH